MDSHTCLFSLSLQEEKVTNEVTESLAFPILFPLIPTHALCWLIFL